MDYLQENMNRLKALLAKAGRPSAYPDMLKDVVTHKECRRIEVKAETVGFGGINLHDRKPSLGNLIDSSGNVSSGLVNYVRYIYLPHNKELQVRDACNCGVFIANPNASIFSINRQIVETTLREIGYPEIADYVFGTEAYLQRGMDQNIIFPHAAIRDSVVWSAVTPPPEKILAEMRATSPLEYEGKTGWDVVSTYIQHLCDSKARADFLDIF